MHTSNSVPTPQVTPKKSISPRVRTSIAVTTLAVSQLLSACGSVPNVYSSAPTTSEQVIRTYDPRTGTMNTRVQSSRRQETYYRDRGVKCVENTRITTRNGYEERTTTSVHCTPVRVRQGGMIRLW